VYLKRLELQGFKSFQTQTAFEFGPGITAVVGPNGSGKSNVAESVRWVLGEQGSRTMRTRRLEDVIFSGSSQKAAVGMADVSMTLDNAEGWLPIDYSEVVVSRRAYRNGDSEYLINKSKVRLRDVVDLFLRAQVGQNSYAFMGQGLVEEVLLMRPEERRRLLEEAADVRLLRTRLDEARDRLAGTRQNLDRVTLLIDEIRPRLRQLERQATRAAEHGRLAGELAQTLRELYGQLWQHGQDALAASRAALDQKQEARSKALEEARACEEGLTALGAAFEEAERDLADRRAKHRDLSDRVHGIERRTTLDHERIEAQARRKTEVGTELQSLRDEGSELQASLDQARLREAGIRPEIEAARALIGARRQELTALEQEHAALRRRLTEAETHSERCLRGREEAESGLARLADEENRRLGEGARNANRKRDLIEHLKQFGRDHLGHLERSRAFDGEIAEADETRRQLAAKLESARSTEQELTREQMRLENSLEQLRAREGMLRTLESEQDVDGGVRFLLGWEGGREGAVKGLLGLVREIIGVPLGMERAIEAALAENARALVFEDFRAALAAVRLLEEHQAGRIVAYPLDSLEAPLPVRPLRQKGVIGVASLLVACEGRFQPLVDTLLGNVVVVESPEVARELSRKGLYTVVTTEGLLLQPSGAVAGGASSASVESAARRQELEQLAEQASGAEGRLKQVRQRLGRAQASLEKSSEELEGASTSLQDLRDARSRTQNALLEGRGRLIMLRGEARSLWADLRRGGEDWDARRTELSEARDNFEVQFKQASEVLEQTRTEFNRFDSQRETAVNAVSEAAAAHANLEGEARSLAGQVEVYESGLARSRQRLNRREATLAEIEKEIASLEERSGGGPGLSEAREELVSLASELEPATRELAHLEARVRGMREQLTDSRNALLEAERALLEAEADVKLRGDEIDALRETVLGEGFRIELGAVAFEDRGPQPVEREDQQHSVSDAAEVDTDALRTRVVELRRDIRALGPVNEQAHADYSESKERFDFLQGQVDDLQGSEQTLLTGIDELESNIRERLQTTFAVVEKEFQRYFESFFNGGSAHLSLTVPEDFANTGIDIVAQPPGKRVSQLSMLSGGERTLTALALLMSLLEAHPSPICVLDEVDAALDETNVGRFVDALRALVEKTQFIIITHNPRTIEAADAIYGVSMGSDSTSRILSLRLDEVAK
jgi:chromosome segregation protein